MKRREFIILSSIGATSASLLSACGHPEEKLIPAFIPDEDYIPGIDYWKATTCGMCPAGCGIIVRTREHTANKIEGNPLHPVNRGALCARGQAGLEVLYNPDRIKGPMKRVGERGEGKWEEISWDEAIKTLVDELREIRAEGHASSVLFLADAHSGVNARVAETFMGGYGSSTLLVDDAETAGMIGSQTFDIANATYLLSFGARFLETWNSPVEYSIAYGEFRHAKSRQRGKLVQIEPRMSLTAANADEGLPAAIGTEGILALGIAQVMIREGLAKNAALPLFTRPIEDYAPEKTSEKVGVPSEHIIRVAREFAGAERPLAMGGGSAGQGPNGFQNLQWIQFLNVLAGNLNKKGGVLLSSGSYLDPLEKLLPRRGSSTLPSLLLNILSSGAFSALLIHQTNPVYASPRLRDKINSIPFIASFSKFIDETTQMADLILPDNTFLESWNLTARPSVSADVAVSVTQPIVKSELNTRQTADVLISLSHELNDADKAWIPFESAEEIVRQSAAHLPTIKTSSTNTHQPQDSWMRLLEQGAFEYGAGDRPEIDVGLVLTVLTRTDMPVPEDANKALKNDESGLTLALMMYEHFALGGGSTAHLPSLQELPDTMTSVMWGSWVEINPKTASSLGISDGDLVEVSTEHGSLRVPAVLYPAIRPDVIAMPFGQGHTEYGRYATNRGANPAVLNPYGLQGTVDAKVSKVEGKASLIRFGTDLQQRMEKKAWR